MAGAPGKPHAPSDFWARVDVGSPDECWPWKLSTDYGYGKTHYQHRRWRSPRLAYALANGPIPAGLVIDHLCRNKICCNPSHLQAVTQRINTLRGISPAAENAKKEKCLRGHPLSGSNLYVPRTGKRHCRACQQIRSAAFTRRRVA